MPLRIGFDLDGVLADMDAALLREAETLFGADAARRMQQASEPDGPTGSADEPADDAAVAAAPMVKLRMTPRQQRRLWRHVTAIDDFWRALQEIEPGAVASLAQLASERRWELIFLTKRPATAGATAQMQSQRWLESKGFALPSVYVVQRSRGLIASALSLDVIVDDRPENCFDVITDSEAKAILVWRESPNTLPPAAQRLGVAVVPSVAACLDLLACGDVNSQSLQTVAWREKNVTRTLVGWLCLLASLFESRPRVAMLTAGPPFAAASVAGAT